MFPGVADPRTTGSRGWTRASPARSHLHSPPIGVSREPQVCGVLRGHGHRLEKGPPMTSASLIVPSVLPADAARLGAEVEALCAAGVDRIQWDVMDGVFVPNLTFGPDVIAAARRHSTVGFEAHLMVVEPDKLLGRYVDAGCELVIVHAEATTHLRRTQLADPVQGAR